MTTIFSYLHTTTFSVRHLSRASPSVLCEIAVDGASQREMHPTAPVQRANSSRWPLGGRRACGVIFRMTRRIIYGAALVMARQSLCQSLPLWLFRRDTRGWQPTSAQAGSRALQQEPGGVPGTLDVRAVLPGRCEPGVHSTRSSSLCSAFKNCHMLQGRARVLYMALLAISRSLRCWRTGPHLVFLHFKDSSTREIFSSNLFSSRTLLIGRIYMLTLQKFFAR